MSKIVDEVEAELYKAEGLGREVLAKRTAIVGAITVIVNAIVAFGWFGPEASHEVLKYVSIGFDALTALLTVAIVRPAVTPVADPRDATGEKLVPVSTVKVVEAVPHPDPQGGTLGAGNTTPSV